jgi:hypothetical protein
MLTPDTINSLFELLGGFFVLGHCRAVVRDKAVSGVCITSIVYFTSWGCWNLFYYPFLGQSLSFYGAAFLVLTNAAYIGMLLYYRKPRA